MDPAQNHVQSIQYSVWQGENRSGTNWWTMSVCRQHPTSVDEISGYTLLINGTSTHREAGFKIAHEGLKLRNVPTCIRSVAYCFLKLVLGNDIVAVYLMSA